MRMIGNHYYIRNASFCVYAYKTTRRRHGRVLLSLVLLGLCSATAGLAYKHWAYDILDCYVVGCTNASATSPFKSAHHPIKHIHPPMNLLIDQSIIRPWYGNICLVVYRSIYLSTALHSHLFQKRVYDE